MESYSQVVLFFVCKNEPGELRVCMKNHSANAHQQVIWLRGISNAGGSLWVERREFYDFTICGQGFTECFKGYGMACVVPASVCTGIGEADIISVWAGCKSISCVC